MLLLSPSEAQCSFGGEAFFALSAVLKTNSTFRNTSFNTTVSCLEGLCEGWALITVAESALHLALLYRGCAKAKIIF